MFNLELVKKWVEKIAEFLADILIPEDFRIKKLLVLPADTMRDLLQKSPVFMKDIFVLFDYQNKNVRLIVKSIKYKNNFSLRKRIAGYFYEELIDLSSEISLFEGSPPILLPMPMSKMEKRKRGFNQCEELVKEIKNMAGDNLEVSCNILKKIRETKKQAELSREERAKNLKNSMSASENSANKYAPNKETKIKNRVIVVLDDVYTTGATLAEARRALLKAGAKRVIGFFIAH